MPAQLSTRDEFLGKYKIGLSTYRKTGLKWDELKGIYADYASKRSDYDKAATFLAETMFLIEGVHSVKKRTKDPEHLIEKIIRKSAENGEVYATIETYESSVTDLIGIRAIHLYKEDWHKIHKYIVDRLNMLDKPTAFISKGESGKHVDSYECNDCVIKEHKADYRSVHYNVIMQPLNRKLIAEIQVRTIFEEGWSEMDHDIRYPYDQDNELYLEYLSTFNNLCRTADKMGSFLTMLKKISDDGHQVENMLRDRDDHIDALSQKVAELEGSEENTYEISKEISQLKTDVLVPEIVRTATALTPFKGTLLGIALAVAVTQFLKKT